MSLQSLFYPRGVAVIGSTSEGKLGYHLIRQMLDGGYREVFAVNPKAQGLVLPSTSGEPGEVIVPGYDSVANIEQPVDLAVVVSPPQTVRAVLEDCGRAGVRAAAIITSGFSEVGNHAAEVEIKRVAEEYDIRVVGPNCAGLLNTSHCLFPTLESRPPAGGVAIIAQSGAVGGVVMAWAKEFGLGISKFVSYGNGADLNEIELLRYMAGDAETQVVALYIESVADGREFMEAVRECASHKPVVVIKAGRTRSGQRATLSHTGSMAGADTVYDAALRQCGAIRVHTIEELFDLCKGFLHVSPVRGRRIAIVTNSGGPGVLAADRAEEVGLEVAEPSLAVKECLAEFLPAQCALKNPIDLTVEGTEDGYRKALLAVLQEYDAALALNVATPYLDSVPLARGVCDAAKQSGKPIVAAFLPRQIVTEAITYLQEHGIPNYPTGERAVAVLARMAEYEAQKASRRPLPEAPTPSPSPKVRGRGGTPMLEPEAMAWLRENGIPVPDFRFVSTGTEAIRACREIGYPVVMKVVAPDIVHKSEWGGVVLDIRDDEAALDAFERIRRAAAGTDTPPSPPYEGGSDFRGVVIYPMIRGAQEVLLGLSHDPQFGPVVVFGLGGVYTEIWRDISLRVAPVDRAGAQAMIRELRCYPILEGIRGQTPCDLDALADLLVIFSQLPFRYPDVAEVDLNPVFVFAKGLVVGDVRVIWKEQKSQ